MKIERQFRCNINKLVNNILYLHLLKIIILKMGTQKNKKYYEDTHIMWCLNKCFTKNNLWWQNMNKCDKTIMYKWIRTYMSIVISVTELLSLLFPFKNHHKREQSENISHFYVSLVWCYFLKYLSAHSFITILLDAFTCTSLRSTIR